jgi:hypothetical protein
MGNLNFEVTETPKFVLVAGKTSGIESIILVMIDSKFGITLIVLLGIFLSVIDILPLLSINKEI